LLEEQEVIAFIEIIAFLCKKLTKAKIQRMREVMNFVIHFQVVNTLTTWLQCCL